MSAARTERLLNLLTLLLNARRPISLRELRTHEEFRAYYDKYRTDLADFMEAAMTHYADHTLDRK